MTLLQTAAPPALSAGDTAWVAVAVPATMACSVAATAGVVGLVRLVRLVRPLRVPLDTELVGVDVAEHGEHGHHGGIGELAGGRVPLTEGVLVPSHALPDARAATAA